MIHSQGEDTCFIPEITGGKEWRVLGISYYPSITGTGHCSCSVSSTHSSGSGVTSLTRRTKDPNTVRRGGSFNPQNRK